MFVQDKLVQVLDSYQNNFSEAIALALVQSVSKDLVEQKAAKKSKKAENNLNLLFKSLPQILLKVLVQLGSLLNQIS